MLRFPRNDNVVVMSLLAIICQGAARREATKQSKKKIVFTSLKIYIFLNFGIELFELKKPVWAQLNPL